MGSAVELSQPEHKRLRLGKFAQNVINRFGRRNNSIDPVSKGTFVSLKHPYEWNIKQKPPAKHSFIHSPRDASDKVNNLSFENSHYKDNLKNNDPISSGQEIAKRMNYMNREKLNRSSFMNTKYLK